MNSFDAAIIASIKSCSQHSWIMDNLMLFLATKHLFKGGVLVTIVWWAWFKGGENHSKNREQLISTLYCSVIAIILGRALALTLPFRHRPLYENSLGLSLPHGMPPATLETWSSLPSDHAVLFFTLSVGLLFISKRIGIFACLYTALIIAFPRIYLGLHYPTDILLGAVIGATVATIGNRYSRKMPGLPQFITWSQTKPSVFYPLFFLLTYQIATMFDDIRAAFRAALLLLEHMIA